MQTIMIIEDSKIIREELSIFLRRYGYDVDAPSDFSHIVEYILEENPRLLLLDINLPLFDGYYICREIRKKSNLPIIIVTSRDSEMDEIMSMNLGADDFITKPYNTHILLARISSILRRVYGGAENNILSYGEMKLNLSSGIITFKDNSIEVTKNEIKILSYLINNKGNIISRESLMEHLWNADFFVDDNTLSVNIRRLRKKLDEIGMIGAIETRRGLGYIMPSID